MVGSGSVGGGAVLLGGGEGSVTSTSCWVQAPSGCSCQPGQAVSQAPGSWLLKASQATQSKACACGTPPQSPAPSSAASIRPPVLPKRSPSFMPSPLLAYGSSIAHCPA